MISFTKLLPVAFLGAFFMSGCANEDPASSPLPRYTVEFLHGRNGTVEPLGLQIGDEGTEVYSVAKKDEEYKFAGWYNIEDPMHKLNTHGDIAVDGDTLKVKLTKLTADQVYEARFAKTIYTIYFDVIGAGKGSISSSEEATSAGNCVSSKATPMADCGLEGWYDVASGAKIESTNPNDPVYLSSDSLDLHVKVSHELNKHKYTAKFIDLIYNVKFAADANGIVTRASGEGLVGDEVISVATPNPNYKILGWYDGDVKIESENTEDPVYLSEKGLKLHVKLSSSVTGKIYKAKFESQIYAVSFSTEAAGNLDVYSAEGTFSTIVSSTVSLKPECDDFYIFDAWYDGDLKIVETRPHEDVYVSEKGHKLNVRLSSALNTKRYMAKFISEDGNATSRLYVYGTGDDAMLKLTKRVTNPAAIFQFGSIIAWAPAVEKLSIQFDPSSRNQLSWSNTWSLHGIFPENTAAYLNKGMGDPCRLIGFTQKEIKDKLKQGIVVDNSKWRMASNSEHLSFCANRSVWTELDGVYGFYFGPGATSGGTGGEFFPAWGARAIDGSPDRVGNHADFWSNTPRGEDAHFIHILGDGSSPGIQSYDKHANGHTIRCVRR
ncbi:MAG: InlB B-repeat-containing protein [Phocaeicola sp.]